MQAPTSTQPIIQKIKVLFNKETHLFPKEQTFVGLLAVVAQTFGSQNLPATFKFFYSDEEGDIISISCQEDYEEAFESGPQILFLVLSESLNQAMNLLSLN